MNDIRWFAPNRYCMLPVEALRGNGLSIATEGESPARLAFAADGVCATEAYQYAWRHRVPLVVYLWDLPPWQVGRGKPNPVVPFRGKLLKIPRLGGGYPERAGYFSRQRYVAQRADQVWVPSNNTKQDVERIFAVAAERLPFCFDSHRFNHEAGRTDPDGVPTILAISRLTPPKNHAAIIRAAALLTDPVRVRIVGRGAEAEGLRVLGRELGVDLLLDDDWQNDEQIVHAYRGADVVVSLSRFEGLGLTPIEATAMGLPVVASDIPPHREFAGENVRLVPLDDDAGTAAAIAEILRAGRRSAAPRDELADLTIEACAERLLRKFELML